VGDLAATPAATLTQRLGPGAGRHFHHLAWNRDPRSVETTHRAGSMGAQSALGRGIEDRSGLGRVLLGLSDRVSGRMRAKGRAGRTITVGVRFADMSRATRAVTLPAAIATTAGLHHAGLPLLDDARSSRSGPLTLVSISVSKLENTGPLQLELPFEPGPPTRPGTPTGAAHLMIDEQVDKARARFGRDAVGRASVVLDRAHRSVPDGFRKLAERDEESEVDD
jgi:DNA polymerase-4